MANIIKTILAKLKRIQTTTKNKNTNSVVGIDIGSSNIKVVQLKKQRGRLLLETYGEIALGPYAEKPVGEVVPFQTQTIITALTDILREANVTTRSAGVAMQSSSSLIFMLSIPRVAENELESIITNESRKYIPMPITDVALDWWPVPDIQNADTEDDKKEVLVAAIRNETVRSYKNLIAQSSITSSFFELEVFSTIRSVLSRELSSTVLVDIGASATRVAIVQYGVVRTFHVINKGAHAITMSIMRASEGDSFEEVEAIKKEIGLKPNEQHPQATEVVSSSFDFIFKGIKDVVLQYEKESHKAVSRIIFTGGGARTKGFLEVAQEKFDLEVSLGDPFKKAENPEFLNRVLEVAGPEFSVAMGLALKSLI